MTEIALLITLFCVAIVIVISVETFQNDDIKQEKESFLKILYAFMGLLLLLLLLFVLIPSLINNDRLINVRELTLLLFALLSIRYLTYLNSIPNKFFRNISKVFLIAYIYGIIPLIFLTVNDLVVPLVIFFENLYISFGVLQNLIGLFIIIVQKIKDSNVLV